MATDTKALQAVPAAPAVDPSAAARREVDHLVFLMALPILIGAFVVWVKRDITHRTRNR
ncbi:hypothetical protein [Stenotrophomonas maltophilia]|uniref:hypothetical protein n=1 Tax=Stenotrophomonas maltophilia TaxID=40324 RepID=UPI0013DB8638|nr:hypothetical protein [Stenotrophomonas maltophilia]